MKKIFIICRNDADEKDVKVVKEKAAEYFANRAAGNFIFMDVWAHNFISKTFRAKLNILMDVVDEADVVYLDAGWTYDPMCRILKDYAEAVNKTVVG